MKIIDSLHNNFFEEMTNFTSKYNIYIRMKKNTIKIRNSQNNYGKLYVFNLL
jgi:hypothetical protein